MQYMLFRIKYNELIVVDDRYIYLLHYLYTIEAAFCSDSSDERSVMIVRYDSVGTKEDVLHTWFHLIGDTHRNKHAFIPHTL